MESKERLAVRRGLNELKPYLAAYVATNSGSSSESDRSDIAGLLRTMIRDWDAVYSRQLPRAVRSYIHELADIRNRWAHEADFSHPDVSRALDTMKQVASAIGAPSSKPAVKAGRKTSQRQTMREIYATHRGKEEPVIKAYADAERAGKVQRLSQTSGHTPEQYAQALLNDGLKKGWLP